MGNRLSKIVTKTGDHGETGLAGKIRVAKNHPRIEAVGTVDELNSNIGLLMAHLPPEFSAIKEELFKIQHHLFNLGGELVMPERTLIKEEMVGFLENAIVFHNEPLPYLKEFILPSGSIPTCHAHICRTIARRLERNMISLHQIESLNKHLLQYINRLSDYFFVISRVIAKATQETEIFWNKDIGQ